MADGSGRGGDARTHRGGAVIAAFESTDGRLLARMIHLAHRFGCTYAKVEAEAHDGMYSVRFHFTGPDDALGRLSKQIDKLNHEDRENS